MIALKDTKVYFSKKEDLVLTFTGLAESNVSKGDNISPETVIFEGKSSRVLQSLNLAKELGVKASEVSQHLLKDQGEIIDKGDVIARRSVSLGLAERISFSQYDGKVSLDRLDSGIVDIMAPFEKASIQAGIYGKVNRVFPVSDNLRSISILASSFVVVPFLSNGENISAPLKVLKDGNAIYAAGDIGEDFKNSILVAGRKISVKFYEAAAEAGVQGIIAGSMDRGEFEQIGKMPIPIILLEGWGTVPISEVSLDILKDHEDKLVYLNIEDNKIVVYHDDRDKLKSRKSYYKIEDKAVFQIKASDEDNVGNGSGLAGLIDIREVKEGDIVKILDYPYWAYTGKVIDILNSEDLIQVVIDSGRKVLLAPNTFILV